MATHPSPVVTQETSSSFLVIFDREALRAFYESFESFKEQSEEELNEFIDDIMENMKVEMEKAVQHINATLTAATAMLDADPSLRKKVL